MIRFVTIGRVLYDKGYKELIEASKKIKSEYSDVEFEWLGEIDESYPEYVSLEKVLSDEKNGYISYHGFSNNVKDFIKEADCIILPSYHEGMSRTLMESLAMSRPIITTNISGCRETVDDGENGFLCEARSCDSLVTAIKKFLSLSDIDRKKMGRRSREKAEKQFDVNNVIKIYDKIISGLQDKV